MDLTQLYTYHEKSLVFPVAALVVGAGSTAQIARMPGNSTRVQALLDFYAGLTPEQLAAEATKLDKLPMNERMMVSILLFGRWAEVDPTAAMAFSSTMGMAPAIAAKESASMEAVNPPESTAFCFWN